MQAVLKTPRFGVRHAWLLALLLLFSSLILAGCDGPSLATAESVSVTIQDSQQSIQVKVQAGSNVQAALDAAKITLKELDRVDPPTYTLIDEPLVIHVIRVTEEFEVEEKVIPFDHLTVRNESLPAGEQRLAQPGVNGVQQLTYRRILENGVETSRSLFNTTTTIEPQAEIIMIGVQAPFRPLPIPGTLVYLSGGNAWMMQDDTGNRIPLITTADLDGRIFSLSGDGSRLLFSRKAEQGSDALNSLWVVNLTGNQPEPAALDIENVIHFAGWSPGSSSTIYYSTVEPRGAAPGWQANNDLRMAEIGADGLILNSQVIIGANSGGIYGWWGTSFSWSPDGSWLAYARPDSIGLVDFDKGSYYPLMDILPFQTGSDWAWVPSISWSADSQLLYVVTHDTASGMSNTEISPIFNLSSVTITTGQEIPLVQKVGMFAHPEFSPAYREEPLRLAYLEAAFPEQSDTSRYRLLTIDQDGSNRELIFPPEGSVGLEPQSVVWAPSRQEGQPRYIAFIYQGNIWLIDPQTALAQQVTGDGLVSRIDWQ